MYTEAAVKLDMLAKTIYGCHQDGGMQQTTSTTVADPERISSLKSVRGTRPKAPKMIEFWKCP